MTDTMFRNGLAWQLHILSDNVHISINLQLCALPVKDIPSGNSHPSRNVLDDVVWEYPVPHINVTDFTNEALIGVKVTQVIVWILSKEDFAPRSDGVTLLVHFGQAFPAVHEDVCCSCLGIPGETQVGLQGLKLRNLEEHSFSTQVEGQSTATNLKKKKSKSISSDFIKSFDKIKWI